MKKGKYVEYKMIIITTIAMQIAIMMNASMETVIVRIRVKTIMKRSS